MTVIKSAHEGTSTAKSKMEKRSPGYEPMTKGHRTSPA